MIFKPAYLDDGENVFKVTVDAPITKLEELMFWIDDDPNTIKSWVTVNEPDMVSLPTTVNNEPSNLKLLSTVALGELPLRVNIPLS
jgi:hypothetical protein